MKYKVLITGKNEPVVDEFFMRMSEHFEVLSTSIRYEDITRHMNYFVPDVFVCCIYKEQQEHINIITGVKSRLSQMNIPLVVIGSREDCSRFEAGAPRVSDLTLCLPLSADFIRGEIFKLIQKFKSPGNMGMQSGSPVSSGSPAGAKPTVPSGSPAAAKPGVPSGSPAGAKPTVPSGSPAAAKPSVPSGSIHTAKPGVASGNENRVVTATLISKARTSDQAYEDLLAIMERQLGLQGLGNGSTGRKHILIVDDDSMMLKLMKEYLHEKYDVATAVNGKIALKFLERKRTDLILLDYEMPGENGPAVLEQLRALEETRNIPVVFLTGVTEGRKIQEALALKPQSYLLKPIQREKLLEAIRKIIG